LSGRAKAGTTGSFFTFFFSFCYLGRQISCVEDLLTTNHHQFYLKEHFSREKEYSIGYNKSCSTDPKQLISRLKNPSCCCVGRKTERQKQQMYIYEKNIVFPLLFSKVRDKIWITYNYNIRNFGVNLSDYSHDTCILLLYYI